MAKDHRLPCARCHHILGVHDEGGCTAEDCVCPRFDRPILICRGSIPWGEYSVACNKRRRQDGSPHGGKHRANWQDSDGEWHALYWSDEDAARERANNAV